MRKLGIKDVVNFAGRIEQNNLNTYYNAADALVIPSFYESFGLVALESLACGTPVIATPVGAMESIIHASETGQVLLDSSPHSLAMAIEAFIAKQHANTIPPQTVRASVRKFSWSHMASAIMDEYATAFHSRQNARARAL